MSAVRRNKEISATNAAGGGVAKITTVHSSKTTRSTTPVSDRSNISTGKENINSSRSTSRIRAAAKPQKPLVPPIVKQDRVEPRARWSTSVPRGRSSSPSEFNRVTSDVRKTRVSRVSGDRNDKTERIERSVSVGRSTRVSDKSSQQKKRDVNCKPSSDNESVNLKTKVLNLEIKSEVCEELKNKNVMTQTAGLKTKVVSLEKKSEVCEQSKNKSVTTQNASLKTECGSDSVMMKVSESVKLFEKFKSKSCVGLRSGNGIENEEKGARLSFGGSIGKVSSRGSSLDGLSEKGGSDDGLSGRSSGKYPSKLHGKLAFLEEKVKRIASDIKRTKEMLDLNNPDASKVMLSDIQQTVAGIEKAMGDVVEKKGLCKKNESDNVEKEKQGLSKVNESDNVEINVVKKSTPIQESSSTKSTAKGLNTDELEARLFPHHKLLRDRSTLKATSGNKDTLKSEVALVIAETKVELSDSLTKDESKVTTRGGGLEICEVQETDSTVSTKSHDNPNTCNVKGGVETTLTTDETLDDFDEQENKTFTVFEVEMDDSFNNQLNEIGNKTSTGGWFVSEGESVLLAHDDSSCTFYDVANSEEKSIYKAPSEVSPNLWRDCWILRAPGADGCAGRYVVAASAGNSMDSGFCSWDFYTKEVKAFHIEDGVTNKRTALAPLPNNVLNRRHDLANLTPENRQWWYKPSGPLIVSTASNQKVVSIYDIRDGEHIMQWEVQNCVSAMENSSPLQWRSRGKVVVAEAEIVCLWDVGSLTPEPLLSVSSSGKKISALHINNTDAELGGGVRQRVSSSEAEGNDGIFCTSDSINILDFRHPSGIGLKIPNYGTTAHSVFSKGDSIYLGCSASPSSTRKPTSTSQIQQFSILKQKLFSTYTLPESNAHPHYKAITQVWGDSNLIMGVCGLGLFVFDALKDDGSKPFASDYGNGQKIRETVGPNNLYCPSFDYLGSRALLISRDRPAVWKYLS